jgi:hypothetical protein
MVALDPERIDQLTGLVDEPIQRVLRDFANHGVPLFLREEHATAPREPYASARVVAPDIMYAALRDVSEGHALLLSQEHSGAALVAAGAHYSPLAATPKKDAEGNIVGKRMITDETALNSAISEDAAKVGTGLTPPPAVCPSLKDVARAILMLATCFPGIALWLAVFDISNAYKKMLLRLTDAPAQAAVLPTQGLDVEGLTMVSVESAGAFGAKDMPGDFGIAAWTTVGVASALGPPEPHFNGPPSAARTHSSAADESIIAMKTASASRSCRRAPSL